MKMKEVISIYICSLWCVLNDSEKNDDVFCVGVCQSTTENVRPTVKKLDLCVFYVCLYVCVCVKYWMGKNVPQLPLSALFSRIHAYGSIFKLNYWISSMRSNMHMYSCISVAFSLSLSVHCACSCLFFVWLWLLYVMYYGCFWGSVHL